MSVPSTGPLLTLEPLIEAIRDGVELGGWELSGLQKTTSHQFEGRWKGESTRSAYLFFHHTDRWELASVDVFLDETSRGLQGSLSLVVDGPPLGTLGDAPEALSLLGAAAREAMPPGHSTPVSLRIRLPEPTADPAASEVEVRFKLRIPKTALTTGSAAVSALARTAVLAFEALLTDPALQRLVALE